MKKYTYHKWIVIVLCLSILWPQGLTGKSLQVLAATTGTVTATSLNVRSGPDTTYSIVQVGGSNVFLKKDEKVTILEEKKGWYTISIKFGGKSVEGYVMKDYIKVSDSTDKGTTTPTPTPKPKPNATPKPTVKPQPTKTPVQKAEDINITKADYKIAASITATNLNIRKKPTTSSTMISSLVLGTNVTILNEVNINSEKWYRISYMVGKVTKTGYALSKYVKLTLKKSTAANINSSTSVKIRSGAGESYSYVIYKKSGSQITLKSGRSVTITKEVTDKKGNKWFKVGVSIDSVKYTGYILSDNMLFKGSTTQALLTPTPSKVPTVIPTPTPTTKPSVAPTITPTPLITPTVTVTPTPTITPIPTPTPMGYIQEIKSPTDGRVYYTTSINVIENIYVNYNVIFDTSNLPIVLTQDQKVTIYDTVTIDSTTWYYISFIHNSFMYFGYIQAEYILIGDGGIEVTNPTPTPTTSPTPISGVLTDAQFEVEMQNQGFPESYKRLLRQLHQQYPTWIFEAFHTGLNWNTVIEKEGVIGINLISSGKSTEWKSIETGAYDWKTDKFIAFDGSTWVTTSKAGISYYMDPRNFLNEMGIFQFELLKYKSEYQNVTGVEGILYNTPLYNSSYSYKDDNGKVSTCTYSDTFIKAAVYSGVSPYHLAARVKQEVVTGTKTLSSSVSGTVSGYIGLYNFFNIGAYHSTAVGGAVANGLKYAKDGTTSAELNALYKIPWDSPYASIVGGAYSIGRNYISRGQDTIYLQKFNVTGSSTYSHQYMANVEAPNAEAKKTFAAYTGMMNVPIVFSIPVYNNMPEQASPVPTIAYNPNNWLKTLKVAGYTLTPTFNISLDQPYSIIVGNDVASVNVSATTVSSKATVSGTGNISLQVGNNQVVIRVLAENGNMRDYNINIVRE